MKKTDEILKKKQNTTLKMATITTNMLAKYIFDEKPSYSAEINRMEEVF